MNETRYSGLPGRTALRSFQRPLTWAWVAFLAVVLIQGFVIWRCHARGDRLLTGLLVLATLLLAVGCGVVLNRSRVQRRAEIALRTIEERIWSIFENSPAGVALVGLDGRYLMVNPAFSAILGYTTEELLRTDFFRITHPDDLDRSHQIMRNVTESQGRSLRFTKRYLHKDGRTIWAAVSSEVVVGPDGSPAHFVTHLLDITERKQAEETLRESEQRFRVAFDNAPTGMSIIGPDGFTYLAVNPLLCEMFGYTKEEFLGNSISLVTHPDDEARSREWVRKKLHDEPCEPNFEKRYVHKDGHIVWGLVRAQWIKNEDGSHRMAIAHILDITERKRAEEQIRRLNEELEQRVRERTAQLQAANQELEAFSYSVSHDLRAPLRHIAGYVNLLQTHPGAQLDAEGRRLLATVGSAAKRMGVLINDLLAFSRLGRAPVRLACLDLNRMVRECLQEMAPDLKDRRIEWVIPSLPQVLGDWALLKQVLLNLLGNAVKYTRTRPEARIELGFLSEATEWQLAVRDNGIGFDMKYAGKLFGVFQRLHSSEEFEGTGIGLANVRRVIARHGGRTWAEGIADQGAVFYFTLPKQTAGRNETVGDLESAGASQAD